MRFRSILDMWLFLGCAEIVRFRVISLKMTLPSLEVSERVAFTKMLGFDGKG